MTSQPSSGSTTTTILRARKRLYMTATPRIYDDATRPRRRSTTRCCVRWTTSRSTARSSTASGSARPSAPGLLTDYKVLVLAVDETYVARSFRASSPTQPRAAARRRRQDRRLLERPGEAGHEPGDASPSTPRPMRRAVAFARSIKDSQASSRGCSTRSSTTTPWPSGSDASAAVRGRPRRRHLQRAAAQREARLAQGADRRRNVCRILSNARCLSEGVDVPALDAVMFLNPRNSVVDVVQSVGRVMRRAPGKEYGYIILPIGIRRTRLPRRHSRTTRSTRSSGRSSRRSARTTTASTR